MLGTAGESVMRHIVQLTLTPGALTCGVFLRPARGALVALTGPAQRLPSASNTTLTGAVDVAVIATPADPDLSPATLAVVEPEIVLAHADASGQRQRIGA